MRTAGYLVATLLLGLLATQSLACRNNSDAGAAPDPAALKAQQDLISRRDALMAQREALEGERDKVVAQLQEAEAQGGDPSAVAELTRKKEALEDQIQGQSSDLTALTSKLDAVVARGDATAAIAAREANLSGREGSIAQREKQLAERERVLAGREATLAQREKETCGTAPPMIIQAAPTKSGGSYGKADVQPLLAKAKKLMQKKGILASDLPGGAQNLENQATDAMGAGDWGKAYFAAAQLAGIVEQLKIDRLFIQAKMARLNKQVRASTVDEATNQQLAAILGDVAQKYNDGNFGAANARLNQLASQLR